MDVCYIWGKTVASFGGVRTLHLRWGVWFIGNCVYLIRILKRHMLQSYNAILHQ